MYCNVKSRRIPVTIVAVEKQEVFYTYILSVCLYPYLSGKKGACAVLYGHMWISGSTYFPTLSHKGTIFGNKRY